MRRAAFLASLLVLTSCLPSNTDPHAVAPDYDRWESRIPVPRGRVFSTIMTMLVDSGYTIRNADSTNGIIATNLRRMRTNNLDYRLDVMVQPTGGDSTRVVFRGEHCQVYDGALTCYPQTLNSLGWFVVSNAGQALLQRVSTNSEH